MWTLECDGPYLANKRIWLRPGKKYILGRTPPERSKTSSCFRIDDKTVSRKHITISVSTVKSGSGTSVHARSEIILADENTKFGTVIDGQRVASGASTVLKDNEHTFKLGKNTHIFHVKWHPVVLSVSFSSKEIKASKDPLATLRTRLEDTDIKVVNNYIIGSTTHVVHSKRNTPKGLQALINGKYIVADSFVDALIYATTPTDLDQDESQSPLEEDFDGNWPDAMQHVPPKGKEPNERPVEKFAPNPERLNVFEGYTVVFCEKGQFESLQAPITNGGGKALYFELRSGQTTTNELVGYVKNVAGEKGLGELEDGSEGKGVVVVKFRGASKDDFDWAAQLGREASLALDLRFIEQNEFMDAILMNDASVLRRPLEIVENDDEPDSTYPGATQNGSRQAIQESQPESSEPPPPPRRQRGLIKSRFKGFSSDDDDDKPSLSSIPPESQFRPSQPNNTQLPDSPSQAPVNPRKRPAPTPAEDDNADFVDQLLPAATAMKRRRLEAVESARRRGESPPATKQSPPPTTKATTRKVKEPIDIKASLRSRREAADAALARDEETLRHDQDLTVEAIESMRDLALIEEFNIAPHRNLQNSNINGSRIGNPRWDPLWNGRKNFKKFRRQGEGGETGGGRRRGIGQTLIVPLEEVKKKDFGIGEEYWLESGGSLKRKRKEKEKESRMSESQFAVEAGGESEGLGNGTAMRVKREGGGRQNIPKELLVEDDEEMPDVVDVKAPRRTRGMDTQTQSTSSAAGAKGKPIGRGRQKQPVFAAKDDDSESEDELKFRFGKRRRMGQ